MTDSERLDIIIAEMQKLNQRMTTIETEVKDIKTDVKATKLIMENELRVNIQRVAEGHLDLSRNLHETMKSSNEIEMLAIKVRMLESDVMELKRKLA